MNPAMNPAMTTTQLSTTTAPRVTTRQKVGLGLAALLSAGNVVSILFPTPDGEVGPPMGILLIGVALGLAGLVAVVLAWRGGRLALRVAAGCIIVSVLTSLPAFFVDVPMGIKMIVAVSVLLTLAALVLMFSSQPRPTSVLD